MDQTKLYELLKNPKFYGPNVKSVKIIQTHISYVALTGSFAYKVKKPVNFGFLDFSTLEKRKFFCEEELRLNKRLCPETYLDVLPITRKNNSFELNGKGEVVEYVLKMREFPQEKIMTNLLRQGKIDEEKIDHLCDILVGFYNSQTPPKEITKYGELKVIKQNVDENFDQTKSFIDLTIPKRIYRNIKEANTKLFERKKEIFSHRIKAGCIKDCHGDLHSGNIVITDDKIHIFDCIEFNKRFRFGDVASDIGFLAMDLDFLGHPYLSSYFIEKYVEKSGDTGIFDVLNFYKSYRAYVRGKVIGFKLNDTSIDKKEKQETIETAKKYFDLSEYYALLFSRDLRKSKPILFITSGLTGTGKTTVARKISIDYTAQVLSTDKIRKELEGIDKFERHYDSYNTGLYSPDKMFYTYKKTLEKSDEFLKKGRNVVLDATFKTKELRDMAFKIAKKNDSIFVILFCDLPELHVKRYLQDRVKKKSISDGRWEIYLKQKDTFEPPEKNEDLIMIDISKQKYDYQIDVFRRILNKVNEG